MGDFLIEDAVYDRLGIERVEMTSQEVTEYMSGVTEAEIDAQIAEDTRKYDLDPSMDKAFLRNHVKGDLAVALLDDGKGGLENFALFYLLVALIEQVGDFGVLFKTLARRAGDDKTSVRIAQKDLLNLFNLTGICQ